MRIWKALALIVALALLAPAAWPGGPAAANAAADRAGDWQNILLLGSDARDASWGYGNSDSMIVLSVNYGTGEAKLTSFMRDLWVKIPGRKGEHKLNAACAYGGPELTMRTLNEYFGLGLEYYAFVSMNHMADIIDQLGGLRLDVTEAERKALNKGLFDLSSQSGMEKLETSGKQVLLNGNQAVAFARIRKIDSDYRRTERQRTVLSAIARRLQKESAITIIGVVGTLLKQVETNMDLKQLTALAGLGLRIDLDDVSQFRVPADNTYTDGMFGKVWCIKADMERNRKLLRQFIYG